MMDLPRVNDGLFIHSSVVYPWTSSILGSLWKSLQDCKQRRHSGSPYSQFQHGLKGNKSVFENDFASIRSFFWYFDVDISTQGSENSSGFSSMDSIRILPTTSSDASRWLCAWDRFSAHPTSPSGLLVQNPGRHPHLRFGILRWAQTRRGGRDIYAHHYFIVWSFNHFQLLA